jgi:hypothetical protein
LPTLYQQSRRYWSVFVPGNFSLVEVDGVANRLLLAFKIEVLVTGDLFRHFVNKPLSRVAITPDLLGIRLHSARRQQIENRPAQDIFGETVGAGKSTERSTALRRAKCASCAVREPSVGACFGPRSAVPAALAISKSLP